MIPQIKIYITGVDNFTKTLGQSMSKMESLGNGMRNVGQKMTMGLTLPILGFGTAAVKSAADFEAIMNRVQVVTDASQEEMKLLTAEARRLGSTTKFTATQAAESIKSLGLAGLSTTQIMQSLESVLRLAAAENIDLELATEIAVNTMSGFNLKASEMSRVVDIMTKAAQMSTTDVTELGEAMKYVGPVASGMGISFEETAAALGILSNAGIRSSMAGTTLRGVLSRLGAPTKEARDILNSLKIPKTNIIDAKGNIKSLAAVVGELGKSGINTSQLLEVFGDRAGPGMAALIGAGIGQLDRYTKAMGDAAGTAQKASDVQLKGLWGAFYKMKAAFVEMSLAIANSGLLEFLTKLFGKIKDLMLGLSQSNPFLLKLGVIFLSIVAAIGPLLLVLGNVLIVMAAVGMAVAKAGGIIGLFTNPIGWTIAAIGAFIAMVAYMATHTKSKFTQVMSAAFPLGAIAAWVIARWQRILPFIKLVVWGIVSLMKLLWKLIKPIIDPIMDLIASLGKLMWDVMDGVLKLFEIIASKALPDWLKKKIGFVGPGGVTEKGTGTTPVGAGNLLDNFSRFNSPDNSMTNIRIEDRAGVKITSDVEQGNVQTDVFRGLAFEGGY